MFGLIGFKCSLFYLNGSLGGEMEIAPSDYSDGGQKTHLPQVLLSHLKRKTFTATDWKSWNMIQRKIFSLPILKKKSNFSFVAFFHKS